MAPVQSAKADDHQFRLIDDALGAARSLLVALGIDESIGVRMSRDVRAATAELHAAFDALDNLPPF